MRALDRHVGGKTSIVDGGNRREIDDGSPQLSRGPDTLCRYLSDGTSGV
jgi:hypothetical protein